jgi:hypothetical protein
MTKQSKKDQVKGDYEHYGSSEPTDRINELELIAFTQVTGEEVGDYLELISEDLAKEYKKLCGF